MQSDNEIWSSNRIRKIFFLKNHVGNKIGKLVSDPSFSFFEKALFELEASGLQLSFNKFR